MVQLFRNTTEEWYHVRINDEEIICTGGHPFYVLNAEANRKSVLYEGTKTDTKGKWITAKELKGSDQVLLSDGSCAIIETIEVEILAAPETTYNFEVADYHTYYVSDSKVLVHNACTVDSADDGLDWDSVVSKNGETRYEHVMKHGKPNPSKVNHTVFADDPIATTNKAWSMRNGVTPILEGGTHVYNIPFANAGIAGENAVRIVTVANTNKLITAYPILMEVAI